MAKKARVEKAVLSKQDIASRKKALSEQKLRTDGALRRAIIGVFVLATSMLGLLSLLSYHPQDRVGPHFQNAVGPFGHGLAETLQGALGVSAYVLPAAGLYAAMILFVGAKNRRRWPQLLALLVVSLSAATLAQLFLGDQRGWSYPPGGAVGTQAARSLSSVFSTVGTVILVSAVCVAGLIVGTQFTFLKLCSLAFGQLEKLGQAAKTWVVAAWVKQRTALAIAREQAAKRKLEEAAFLAQLEADQEELEVAEREAEEAEAMAEEAHRLAKAAETKPPRPAKAPRSVALALPPGKLTEKNADETDAELVAGEDPAWARQFSPAAAPTQPLEPSQAKKKERKGPQIVTAQAPGGPVTAEPFPSPSDHAPSSPPMPAPIAQASPAASLPEEAAPKAPATQLTRMPLIVEPKAPPKPTKKKQEQFEFVGERKSFTLPPLDVLECDKAERTQLDKDVYLSTAEKLRAKLADFGIVGEVVEIRPGPVVTMYEFLPGPGIKVSKIASLADDLAMAMEAMRVRIVAPIPGKGVVGIEVPNRDRETVFLKEIAEQDAFTKSPSKLTMCVGKDIEGMPYVLDLAKAPHLLIAGTTGSGKSVAVNSMIMSILLKSTPEEVRFVMVDPKMLELSVYEGIPHLLLPVVTDPKKAALALRWAVEEMERRYHLLSEAGVRNIAGYNKLVETVAGQAKDVLKPKAAGLMDEVKSAGAPSGAAPGPAGRKLLIVDVAEGESEDEALARQQQSVAAFGVASPNAEREDAREVVEAAPPEPPPSVEEPKWEDTPEDKLPPTVVEEVVEKKELKKLPYIVVIIDELADLMMVASREVETYIARLAQMARAAGIHLMVATQRPSTDVVTGVIKANFPTRISFMLRSKPDSMTILGTVGAEALLGMGDMLIMPPTSAHLQRVHGAFVSEGEIKKAVDHLKAQGKPVFDDSILRPREDESDGAPEEDELSDELYDQALAVVSQMQNVSISMLQRKMRIGYNRAARMIERMERDGVVGAADGAKPREVLLRPVGEMPGAGAA